MPQDLPEVAEVEQPREALLLEGGRQRRLREQGADLGRSSGGGHGLGSGVVEDSRGAGQPLQVAGQSQVRGPVEHREDVGAERRLELAARPPVLRAAGGRERLVHDEGMSPPGADAHHARGREREQHAERAARPAHPLVGQLREHARPRRLPPRLAVEVGRGLVGHRLAPAQRVRRGAARQRGEPETHRARHAHAEPDRRGRERREERDPGGVGQQRARQRIERVRHQRAHEQRREPPQRRARAPRAAPHGAREQRACRDEVDAGERDRHRRLTRRTTRSARLRPWAS